MDLEGKVAIVTGGGTGIGAGIAKRFVEEGAKVCISGRRPALLESVAKTLPPDQVFICPADVSKPEDIQKIVDTALSFGEGLHILVNNAAMDQAPADVIDLDPDTWSKVLAVNLTGPFLLMKAAIPHMIKEGNGSVINISSLAGIRSIPEMPAYCASKGGLISLTQQAALDYGKHGVRCNVICPGGVKTEMIDQAMSHFTDKLGTDLQGVFSVFTKDVPMKRIGAPEEIGGVCRFLASDQASFITGAVIPVDGGAAIVDVQGASIGNIG